MNHDIKIDQFLEDEQLYVPVDVRSPGEFAESFIPRALNVPIFSNEERVDIGTLYKQQGQQVAKWRAMEIVSHKLPNLLAEIRHIQDQGKIPMIYCWRGGMRSRSVVMFAEMAGLKVKRLLGGYRAFREGVLARMPEMFPNRAVVLYGMTGTGKTDILHRLYDQGYPILDLEHYANHKGSLFGAIDGHPPHNQKTFDALLYHDLAAMKRFPFFLMEGESKRIGRSVQPIELLEKKEQGIHLRIESSLPVRIKRIYQDYVAPHKQSELFLNNVENALQFVLKRLKDRKVIAAIEQAWHNKDYETLIELLIVHYYDPRYQNKNEAYITEERSFNSDDIDRVVREITDYLQSIGLGINQAFPSKR